MAEDLRHGYRRIALAAARAGGDADRAARDAKQSLRKPGLPARFFTPAQHTLVEELSETIIPADSHSGGAKAAKVADYIEQVVRESPDDEQRSTLARRTSSDRSDEPALQRKIVCGFQLRKKELRCSPCFPTIEHMTDIPEVRFFIELKAPYRSGLLHLQDRHSRRT